MQSQESWQLVYPSLDSRHRLDQLAAGAEQLGAGGAEIGEQFQAKVWWREACKFDQKRCL